jgi:hypothetical protein
MDLLKQPSRSANRHGRIQTELVKRLREEISELVDETKTVGEFVRQDSSDVGATLMIGLIPKVSLEDV